MRNIITLHKKNKQEAGTAITNSTENNETYASAAGQPVVHGRQTSRQHHPYSEDEHATVALSDWVKTTSTVELAEEDMNDPDLAACPAGNRGYTLQPG